MKLSFQDQTILITGASAGIGTEFARQLAPSAKKLILVARRTDKLQSLKSELQRQNSQLEIETYSCDLAKRDEIDRLFPKLEGVDILINNAGMGDVAMFEDSSWSKVDQMISLNVIAPLYLIRKLVEGMKQRKRGGILNVSSSIAIHALPGLASYAGTKSFISGFTEALRAELRVHKIVLTQVCPGPVATEFESLATSSSKKSVPPWLELSAKRCVRIALRGFKNDRALVIPGWIIAIGIRLYRFVPPPLRRMAANAIAFAMRRFKLVVPPPR